MVTIQIAGLVLHKVIPHARLGRRIDVNNGPERFGRIILTANCDWYPPDPERLYLPDHSMNAPRLSDETVVHPMLISDVETLKSLKKLGLTPPSPETSFGRITERILTEYEPADEKTLKEFWHLSRKVSCQAAFEIIWNFIKTCNYGSRWSTNLRVLSHSGVWQPLHSVLLPGPIVPGDDGEDKHATVDLEFHNPDSKLLRELGVTDCSRVEFCMLREPCFYEYRDYCRQRYQDIQHWSTPRASYLYFNSTICAGPLQILTVLSESCNVRYTEQLLTLGTTYGLWQMEHKSGSYSPMRCESLTAYMLRKHGRIRIPDGSIVPFEDALGQAPNSQEALMALLSHPQSDLIKETFNLSEPQPKLECIEAEEPVPLLDVWPGLNNHLPFPQKSIRLVRCERIQIGSIPEPCVYHESNIYLSRSSDNDDESELRLVTEKLELNLSDTQIRDVLGHRIREETEKHRAVVRAKSTDAERLLEAAGEDLIRDKLPESLLTYLENEDSRLTPLKIADAAIATYHTDALRQCRDGLDHLAPPKKWSGSKRAVEFVHSLGFSSDWAGERTISREPFLDVDGPFSLPALHDFQCKVVDNVREMLRNGSKDNRIRRGMISMPTGSGKTRVAVQAVIEAMTGDGFRGGILWVADRDELCEQAVEAWRQVWSNIGADRSRLRISRMWGGQPDPDPTSDFHVVVATIQTLASKLDSQPQKFKFLGDFNLVVFDEAHRSIAPTFTSVMNELGLTRLQRSDEPYLIGLTATPYRGYNVEETSWLARRYGSNRLDAGAFGTNDSQMVIKELQKQRVLAEADHEEIHGGRFSMAYDEILQWEKAPYWLPRSVEDRIARDAERTKRIIRAYQTHIESDWPTLIFATSVDHAKTVAALLNQKGIKSRTVSGETEVPTRRRIVERFRRGDIKALVNYGVFREGFDAPKTRAIIVARPVYSPNLYFQMIGRGLRGVKNGGNDRCLILNVRDNIDNFQQALAFSQLDGLWAND